MLSKDSANNSDIIEGGEKIVIIGDASVGKSSIILRYINNTFSENTKPTIGCEHYEKEVTTTNGKVKLSIWDTAGQERFRGLSSSYYKKAKCVIIVYDITRKSSFDKIEFWKEEIVNFAEPDIIIVLVGAKVDLQEKRVIMRDDAVIYLEKNKFAYFTEVSAVSNQNNAIEKLFEKVGELVYDRVKGEAQSRSGLNDERVNEERKNIQLKENEDVKETSNCKCY